MLQRRGNPTLQGKAEERVLPSPCEAPVVLGVWTRLGLAPGRPFQWEVARAVELRQWLRMSDVGIEVHPWRLQRRAWPGLLGLGVAWVRTYLLGLGVARVRTDSLPGGWAGKRRGSRGRGVGAEPMRQGGLEGGAAGLAPDSREASEL